MTTFNTTAPWNRSDASEPIGLLFHPASPCPPSDLPEFQTAMKEQRIQNQELDTCIQRVNGNKVFAIAQQIKSEIREIRGQLYEIKEHSLSRVIHHVENIEKAMLEIEMVVCQNHTTDEVYWQRPEAFDSDQEPEDTNTAEHGSSAPLYSTFGLGSMDKGKSSSTTVEVCGSEQTPMSISKEKQKDVAASPPASDGHPHDNLSHNLQHVPPALPPSRAGTSQSGREEEDLERNRALKLLMLLVTIDHASSPNYANPKELYEEGAKFNLPQLIDRYFERLFKRFGLSPQRPRACGNAQYLAAYDILRKVLQAPEGRRLKTFHLNTKVNKRLYRKDFSEPKLVSSAISNGKFLAELGRYYDIRLDESPYLEISVKIALLNDALNKLGDGITPDPACPISRHLPTHRRQLQNLGNMLYSQEHGFKTRLSALFELIGRSNGACSRLIIQLKLCLYEDLSFNLPSMFDGLGLLDEVNDNNEHAPSDSTSSSSTSAGTLKSLDRLNQAYSKQLNLAITQIMQFLQSRLEKDHVANSQELSRIESLMQDAQALQEARHRNLLYRALFIYHEQMLKEDSFLEAGTVPTPVWDVDLGRGETFYVLDRTKKQLNKSGWRFSSKVHNGHDVLLEVLERPFGPHVSVTSTVYLQLPGKLNQDPMQRILIQVLEAIQGAPDEPSTMRVGRLQGIPESETCHRILSSVEELQDTLGTNYKAIIQSINRKGVTFIVVTGIREERSRGLCVLGGNEDKKGEEKECVEIDEGELADDEEAEQEDGEEYMEFEDD
ncbi:hypothetical protein IL306_001877 [Fusarium sp. DS 682]|nr:hypothetical protein IL306_001877 [Fusarium sp. DS 682]